MNVRLISGTYGGRVIEGSGTDRTHPMSERMRSSLFNIVGDEIEGARVLDVFAGSGALGLEALSRGAESATFIERDRVAQKIIDANITTLKIDKTKAKLVKAPAASWLRTTDAGQFDIIFVDPPYHDLQLSTVAKISGLLKPNGLMVLSYPDKAEVPTELGVVVVDNRSYGNAALAFYRKEDV
ncbi:16S rRNA (guanine(966)-N(2))-methyltransferase RsmD [Candidatus Saccharibacteria bacterium TM7i]|nr:16S rRNA (guanine(966)-N(2))-methyltransferase RsmD [Candidatus Saccharibacteria bacterium TM7i]